MVDDQLAMTDPTGSLAQSALKEVTHHMLLDAICEWDLMVSVNLEHVPNTVKSM